MRVDDDDSVAGAISVDGAGGTGTLDIVQTGMRLEFSAWAQDVASLANWQSLVYARRRQPC